MTGRKIDKIIKDAMLMYQAEAVKEFASYPDTPVEFSQEYKNNMQKMLAGHRRKIVRIDKRRRIARVAVTIVLAFMTLTAFVAREQIIEFFIQIFEDRTFLSTNSAEDDGIKLKYTLTLVPDGYNIESNTTTYNLYAELWTNQNKQIRFTQRSSQNNDIFIDDDQGNYSEIMIEGLKAYYLEKNERKIVVWNFEGYNFKLNCPSELDWETITQMITSIAPQE